MDDKGKHYRFEYKGIKLDPYRIFKIYQVNDSAIEHAIKKLLVPGSRGAKSRRQDVEESVLSLTRWLEMDDEDSLN